MDNYNYNPNPQPENQPQSYGGNVTTMLAQTLDAKKNLAAIICCIMGALSGLLMVIQGFVRLAEPIRMNSVSVSTYGADFYTDVQNDLAALCFTTESAANDFRVALSWILIGIGFAIVFGFGVKLFEKIKSR